MSISLIMVMISCAFIKTLQIHMIFVNYISIRLEKICTLRPLIKLKNNNICFFIDINFGKIIKNGRLIHGMEERKDRRTHRQMPFGILYIFNILKGKIKINFKIQRKESKFLELFDVQKG